MTSQAGSDKLSGTLSPDAFKHQLTEVIPHLRAFGRSLSGRADVADDLVQETMLKAWNARARFLAGSNMRAWTFTILRNVYLSQMRRAKFKGEWNELAAERVLSAPAAQDQPIALGDVQRALARLPEHQREALILVGAGGFSYEEAADICGCAIGTVKSRVFRARAAIEAMIEDGSELQGRHSSDVSPSQAFENIMGQLDKLSDRSAA